MTTNPATQYATELNLLARQRLWERQEPAFDVVGWALDLAGVNAGSRVLDVGCGNGRYLAAIRSLRADAVGCDLSVGMLKSGPTGSVVAADAVALPFSAGQFDVVLAPHMLYHVADRPAAVRELMDSTYNDRDHRRRRARAELARVDRDLKNLRAEVAALMEHRAKLLAELEA